MMHSSSLLLVCELFELSVTRRKPLPRQVAVASLLSRCLQLAVESFATLAALLLTDVAQVAVAGPAQTEKEEE